jgi:copper transport protein
MPATVEKRPTAAASRRERSCGSSAAVAPFSEPVEVQFGAVRVYDPAGDEVQQGPTIHPGGRQDTVGVRLRPRLGHGGYTVTYRVISADSHPVSGGLVFQVGHGGGAAASVDEALAGSESGAVTTTAFAAVRAVQFAAIALALGCWLFVVRCWLPALRAVATATRSWATASGVFAGRVRALTLGAAAAGLTSALAGLILQGATGRGGSFWDALSGAVVSDVLATRFGRVWGIAALLWLGLGVLEALRRAPAPVLRPASLGATGLALDGSRPSAAAPARLVPLAALAFLPALSGHAGTEDPTWLMFPASILHVVCISAWLGGIVVMIVALRRSVTCSGERASCAPRSGDVSSSIA